MTARLPTSLSHSQSGVSLVEILIASTLGLMLSAGLVQVFVNNKQTYRVQDGMLRLQENARLALSFMTRDLRSAGLLGCRANPQMETVSTLNNNTTVFWDFSVPLQGYEATSATAWTPTLDTAIASASGGNDVLAIHHAAGSPALVTTTMSSGSSTVVAAQPTGLATGRLAVISNCVNSAVFQVSSLAANTTATPKTDTLSHATGSGTPGNSSADLTTRYVGSSTLGKNSSEVIPVATSVYYVRTGASGQPALWLDRRDGVNASAQELVEGVSDLQILYGVETDTGTLADRVPNRYIKANDVSDWSKVVSVKIDLTLQTAEDNLADSVPTGATDKRLRRAFSATVDLRNRSL